RVEGINRGLVTFGFEPAQDMARRFARVGEPRFHAAAHVEEQRDAHAGEVAPEIGDAPHLAGIEDLEIAGGQILDEPAFVIANDRAHTNEVDAGFERRNGRRLNDLSGWRLTERDDGGRSNKDEAHTL